MRWIVPLLLVLTVTARAGAQDADELADSEARARFEAGRTAMTAGRPEDALVDFQRAYELSHRPELLYNVGIAADRLRRDDDALAAFERYLAEMPPDQLTNRAEVESRVETLRQTIAARVASAPPPARGPSVPGIVLIVSGGLVAIGGAISLGVGVSERARVENAPPLATWSDYASSAESAPILEGVGGGGLALGVALLATGVAWMVLDASVEGTGAVAIRPFGTGVQLVGQW